MQEAEVVESDCYDNWTANDDRFASEVCFQRQRRVQLSEDLHKQKHTM